MLSNCDPVASEPFESYVDTTDPSDLERYANLFYYTVIVVDWLSIAKRMVDWRRTGSIMD